MKKLSNSISACMVQISIPTAAYARKMVENEMHNIPTVEYIAYRQLYVLAHVTAPIQSPISQYKHHILHYGTL